MGLKNNAPNPISKDGSELLDSSSFSRYETYRKKQFIKDQVISANPLVKKRNQHSTEYRN